MPTLQINETSASLSETTPQKLDDQRNDLSDTHANKTSRKRIKNTDTEDFSRELGNLTVTLQQSIKARQEENTQDYDKMFMLSLLSGYKQIPEHLKSKVQIELIQVIDKYKSYPSVHPQFTRYGFPNTSFEGQDRTGYYTRSGIDNYTELNSSTPGSSRNIFPPQESPHRPSSSFSTVSDLTSPPSNESEVSDLIELFPNN